MISKRTLKHKLIDICNGAGMVWQPEDECFECDDGALVCVGRVIQAVERGFCLGADTRLRRPWSLKEFDDLDSLTNLVYDALQYDMDE